MHVPEGWTIKNINQICKSIVPGRNKPKEFGGDIAWVTTPDITGKYIPTDEQENFISEKTIKECGGKIVPSNSVVMTIVGNLGVTAINKEPIVLNQQLHAYVCSSSIDSEYLMYFLSAPRQNHYMYSIASQTTVPYMNKANCESIPVLLPPLAEQEKIAEILSTWDHTIEQTERLKANAEMHKKALMQQLLTGKKRFPEFEGEWEEKALGDIAKIAKGKALTSKNIVEGDYPVIAGGQTSPYSHNEYTHENVITVSASGAYAGFVAYHDYKIWASDCSVIEGSEEASVKYIYYLLSSQQERIYTYQSGGAQPHVYPRDLAIMRIKLPSLEEQQKIASVLNTADREIELLTKKIEHLKSEKRALMQQLLTGKRRVKVDG